MKITLKADDGFSYSNRRDGFEGIVLTIGDNDFIKDREDMLIDLLAEWAQLNGILMLDASHDDRDVVTQMSELLREYRDNKRLEGTT